jgi:glycerophosphoryl diester phosphodiesterase
MTKTRIIGHRGAAGEALENTMASFKKAIADGARIVEFDVHTTSDGVFVICHDDNLERVAPPETAAKRIKDIHSAELAQVLLRNGEPVPLLSEVLQLLRKHNVAAVVEAKAITSPEQFCRLLDEYRDMQLVVASFNHGLLEKIRALRPELAIYMAEAHRPVTILQEARALRAQGVDLNYMLMNPLTYWLARRWKLDIMVYTVNNGFIFGMLRLLYPKVLICTNYPGRFIRPKSKSI